VGRIQGPRRSGIDRLRSRFNIHCPNTSKQRRRAGTRNGLLSGYNMPIHKKAPAAIFLDPGRQSECYLDDDQKVPCKYFLTAIMPLSSRPFKIILATSSVRLVGAPIVQCGLLPFLTVPRSRWRARRSQDGRPGYR